MYQRIAVGIDGSKESMRAVEEAAKLAKAVSADTVCLVTVIPVLVYSNAEFDPIRAHGEAQTRIVAPAMELLDSQEIKNELIMLHGRPAVEIARYVNETAVDLLVVGRRTLSKMVTLAIGGSISQKLTQQVKCPVLIVK